MKPKGFARLIVVAVSISALVLALVPAVGAEVATSSDAAGDKYKATVAKLKQKRDARLKACARKPKRKRGACRKAANQEFTAGMQKAKEARDQARKGEGGSKHGSGQQEESKPDRAQEHEEYRNCIRETRNVRECKKALR